MSAPEPTVPPPDSAIARIPGVIFTPVKTFESIARRPTWLAPLLLWTVMSLVLTTVMMPRMDWEGMTRAQMEKRGQTVTEEQIQQTVEMQKRFAGLGYVWGGLVPAVISLLIALIFWGAFKAFGSDLSFKQSFGVTTHAFVPAVLASVLFIPLLLRQEKFNPAHMADLLRSNLGFLVEKESSPAVHSLLQSLDVFTFWSLALLVVGYAAAGKTSRGKAAGLILTLWILFVLGKAGWAAAFG
jgi:Yip1 domain